jgi:hypothetical protein
MSQAENDSDEIGFWENVRRNSSLVSIQKCEEASKQMINLTTILTTIYLGVVSLLGNSTLRSLPEVARLFLLIPLPLWLAGLIMASLVIIPREFPVNKSSDAEYYAEISRTKHHSLLWSYGLLITSMVVLLGIIGYYLIALPTLPIIP